MIDNYIKRLIELAKDLQLAREKHEKIEMTDIDLYSRIDYLIGYVSALEHHIQKEKEE